MRLTTLCETAGIDCRLGQDVEITGITESSDETKKGSLFVCIKGKNTDGHDFAMSAYENGASAIVSQRQLPIPIPVIVTEDTRKAYSLLSAAFFKNPARKLKTVGITGTNGKTTVAWILRQIVEQSGRKIGLIGTVENYTGETAEKALHTTPDPMHLNRLIAQMTANGCSDMVMEVSSQALDQQRVAGIYFSCAAFTNLSGEHLDYHRSMEDYYRAKRRLFDACGCAVINTDDVWGIRLANEVSCRVKTYSKYYPSADFVFSNVTQNDNGVTFTIGTHSGKFTAKLPLFGEYNIYNSVCAVACATEIGIPVRTAVDALENIRAPRGRMEEIKAVPGVRIFLDYAHTPDALEKVLTSLKTVCKGRLICLFGCGGDRDRQKRSLMGETASKNCDYMFITSDNPRTESPQSIINDILAGIVPNAEYTVQVDRRLAIAQMIQMARDGDCLLLAGKGHESVQTIGKTDIPFDEREIILESINGKMIE